MNHSRLEPPANPYFCGGLVAQRSATPASVAATPPCSATPFQRQLDVRHSWQFKDGRCAELAVCLSFSWNLFFFFAPEP